MRSALFSFTFLWFVMLCGNGAAELVNKKGKIAGENFVNLRSGPAVGFPSRAVLRKGDEVTIEKEESGWYFVGLPDGRQGYVHKTLVAVLGDAGKKIVVQSQPPKPAAPEAAVSVPPPPPEPAAKTASRGKPLPVVRVLEGREGDILWWLAVALCVFVVGWICGGNYYLRRDRTRRNKLRF
ncbi:MAG: SH3 domain-containing protein [Deltaproteobacteria bacterium]|nr:SH3 domain-containing protein [Deltaproteobacteria bacterium]MBI2211604.1 SH3 domain-containing protein [Deltaproteobacteria bacterium]MBI2991700.1 SH3 domain-containing protein [Deltaproteobacteria bacterium]